MSPHSATEPTGALAAFDPLDEAVAREIVAGAVDRYLNETRARIVPFVDGHFSFRGALALHRRAIGWDLVRAPVNVVLAVPQVLLLLGYRPGAVGSMAAGRRLAGQPADPPGDGRRPRD